MTENPTSAQDQNQTPRETPVGSPAWLELTSNNAVTVKNFYSELFGWTFENTETPGYGFIHQGDTVVAGFLDSSEFTGFAAAGESEAGNPPAPNAWMIYLRAENLEASLRAVETAGGQDLSGIRDVEGQGRFAIALDPSGACVGLWENREFRGLTFPLTPGTPAWFELMTKDYDAATPFYESVFAWDVVPMDSDAAGAGDAPRYATHGPNGERGAGICEATTILGPETPSFWRAYFLTDNTDAALEKVRNLGGSVLDGPTPSPFGRVATVADPTGATFQLVDGQQG